MALAISAFAGWLVLYAPDQPVDAQAYRMPTWSDTQANTD
jgi:hypothetical protein